MAGLYFEDNKWKPNWAWEQDSHFLEWLDSHEDILPSPKRRVGEVIDFKWNNAVARSGVIETIILGFDHTWEREFSSLSENNITYDVRWNGHSRWIKDSNIITPVQEAQSNEEQNEG